MAKLAAHPVLSGILREWLTARAEEYTAARGLPGLHSALNRLSLFRDVVADVAPEAVRLLTGHDVVPLLASTLRTGVLDELGWPALDETYTELAAEVATRQQRHRSESVGVTGAWPALILNTLERAVVIGPEGVLLRHTLRVPATVDHWRTLAFRYVDGELLVIWWEDGKQRGYWSHRPAEVFTVGGEQIARWGGSGPSDEVCLPLPSGGRATGGKALHAGDTSLPPQRAVISDGTGLWREGHQGTQRVWLEYDPAAWHARPRIPPRLPPLRSAGRHPAAHRALPGAAPPARPRDHPVRHGRHGPRPLGPPHRHRARHGRPRRRAPDRRRRPPTATRLPCRSRCPTAAPRCRSAPSPCPAGHGRSRPCTTAPSRRTRRTRTAPVAACGPSPPTPPVGTTRRAPPTCHPSPTGTPCARGTSGAPPPCGT